MSAPLGAAVFGQELGALPAKKVQTYCCSGYQIIPEQGETHPNPCLSVILK